MIKLTYIYRITSDMTFPVYLVFYWQVFDGLVSFVRFNSVFRCEECCMRPNPATSVHIKLSQLIKLIF